MARDMNGPMREPVQCRCNLPPVGARTILHPQPDDGRGTTRGGGDGPLLLVPVASSREPHTQVGACERVTWRVPSLSGDNAHEIPPEEPCAGPYRYKPVMIHISDPIARWEPIDPENERYEAGNWRSDPRDNYYGTGQPHYTEIWKHQELMLAKHPANLGTTVGFQAQAVDVFAAMRAHCPA